MNCRSDQLELHKISGRGGAKSDVESVCLTGKSDFKVGETKLDAIF